MMIIHIDFENAAVIFLWICCLITMFFVVEEIRDRFFETKCCRHKTKELNVQLFKFRTKINRFVLELSQQLYYLLKLYLIHRRFFDSDRCLSQFLYFRWPHPPSPVHSKWASVESIRLFVMGIESFDGAVEVRNGLGHRFPVGVGLLENSEVVIDNLVEKAFLLIDVYYFVPKPPILIFYLFLLFLLINIGSMNQLYVLVESNYACLIAVENISEEYLFRIHQMCIAFLFLIIV